MRRQHGASSALDPKKKCMYPFSRGLAGPQRQTGRFRNTNILPLLGFEPRIFKVLAQSLYWLSYWKGCGIKLPWCNFTHYRGTCQWRMRKKHEIPRQETRCTGQGLKQGLQYQSSITRARRYVSQSFSIHLKQILSPWTSRQQVTPKRWNTLYHTV